MQDFSNSIANAMELPQSCTKPSILFLVLNNEYTSVNRSIIVLDNDSMLVHHNINDDYLCQEIWLNFMVIFWKIVVCSILGMFL